MTTLLRITFTLIVGFFSMYLTSPAIADESMEADEEAALYVDDNDPITNDDMTEDDDMLADDSDDPSLDNNSMPIDEMTDDDGDDPSLDDDSESIDEMIGDDNESALIVSHSGVQAQKSVTVTRDGASCKLAPYGIVFVLNAKGIPLGHHYIQHRSPIEFRNRDTRTHTITAIPPNLTIFPVKSIPAGKTGYAFASKASKPRSGMFEDNIPAGSPTSHQITICP